MRPFDHRVLVLDGCFVTLGIRRVCSMTRALFATFVYSTRLLTIERHCGPCRVIKHRAGVRPEGRSAERGRILPLDLSQSLAISRNLSQSLSISRNLSRSLEVSLDLSQSLSISRNLSRSLAISRNLSRSLSISRNLSRSLSISLDLLRSLSISHGPLKSILASSLGLSPSLSTLNRF